MEPSFFQLNRRSQCLFTPESWCGLFNPTSPVGPLDFLCSIAPQRVAVVLPAPPGEEGRHWDRVFARIAAAWEDRTVGFRCERVGADAWAAQQPCDACARVRNAQVAVLDVQAGNQRGGSFRDLGIMSFGMLKSFKDAAPAVGVPSKRIVLISCGPAPLPPHYLTLFDVVDYADPDGRPDLDRLQAQMLAIARSPALFEAAASISIHFDDSPPPAVRARPAAAAPPVDIVILEETTSQPPAAAAPTASARAVVHELVKHLKVLDSVTPVDDRFEVEVLTRARRLLEESRFPEALGVLNQSAGIEEPRLRSLQQGMVQQCLEAMSPREIVTAFFSGGIVARKDGPLADRDLALCEVSLSAWSEREIAGDVPVATLTVHGADLSAQIGSSLHVWLFADLRAADVEELHRQMERAGEVVAVLVAVRNVEEVPVGLLLVRYREREPPVHLIELRLDEIKRQIAGRDSRLGYLRQQVDRHFQDAPDLYSKVIDKVVCEDGEFFGRQQLIDALIKKLANAGNFAVFGLRRLGKTSLLKRLELINKLDDHLMVLVDLEVKPANAAELYHRVGSAIREAVERKFPRTAWPVALFPALDLQRRELFRLVDDFRLELGDAAGPGAALRSCFVKDLAALLSDLAASAEIRFQRLILLFDEIEQILPDSAREAERTGLDGYREFLAQLRQLNQSSRLTIGLVGFGPVLEQELADHNCPFWGGQVPLLPLGMLTREECADMVRSIGRKRVYFTDEGLEAIFRATGGNPQLAKLLCAEVLSVRPPATRGDQVGAADVRRGTASLLAKDEPRGQLLTMFLKFSRYYPAEAGLLHEIAARAPAPLAIRHEEARRRLIDYGLIQADGGACTLRGQLLLEVLRAALPGVGVPRSDP